MRVGILTFPGSNCDHDVFHVVKHVSGADARYVWHKDRLPEKLDAVIVPGGFSYGDVLGAGGLAENLAMLADGGRLAVIGLQQGRRAELDLGLLLERRATVLGTPLRSRPPAQKAAIMAAVRDRLWPLVASGAVRPVVHALVPLAQAAHAHELMESGAAFGKILIVQ